MIDPLKLLRALEDFLFEAIALLFFYPVTMYRIVRRPLASMQFAEQEEVSGKEVRYSDAVSPPLLLLITILLTGFVAQAADADRPLDAAPLASLIFDSTQYLLLFRSLMFSLLPLVAAVTLLRRLGQPISRETLRPPFYAQCYLVVPFALSQSIGSIGLSEAEPASRIAGGVVCLMGFAWMLWAQANWFSLKLHSGRARGLATATGVVLQSILWFVLVGVVVMQL